MKNEQKALQLERKVGKGIAVGLCLVCTGALSVAIAYTEQRRESHGSMIVYRASYSALIQFCRVVFSRMAKYYCNQLYLTSTVFCRILSSLGVPRRPYVSPSMLRC